MQTVEKWATRSDAWTPQDDEHLATLVLYHIKTGSTQLKAFEDAANQLGRTAAACGYRWNGVVRKTWQQQIEEAKQDRKHSQKAHALNVDNINIDAEPISTIDSSESMKDVIRFLQTFDAGYQKLLSQLQTLETENQLLLKQIEELQTKASFSAEPDNEPLTPEQLEEDSKTLFAIMERARKLLGDGAKSRSDS